MRLLLFTLFFLLLQSIAQAGWVITEESIDSFGNRSIQTTFIQNNVLRYETPTSIVIMDFNTKLITIVFSEHKLYWTGTSDEFKINTVAIYDAQVESMLAGLPKHEREELDSIYFTIKQKLLDTVENAYRSDIFVVKTSDTNDIYGYHTTKYEVIEDTVVNEYVWYSTEVTPYLDINIKDMVSTMKLLNLAPGKGSMVQTKEYLDLLKGGMLLKSVEYLTDGNELVTTVTDLREINIIPDFFIPPNNYMKAKLFDVLYLIPKINREKKENDY